MKKLISLAVVALISVYTHAQTPDKTEKFEDGTVKAEYFVVDANTVDVKFYYSSGQLKETGQFKNNQRHGEWVNYSRKGDITAKGSFNEGAKVGSWLFWDFEGNLSHEVNYDAERPQLIVHNQE